MIRASTSAIPILALQAALQYRMSVFRRMKQPNPPIAEEPGSRVDPENRTVGTNPAILPAARNTESDGSSRCVADLGLSFAFETQVLANKMRVQGPEGRVRSCPDGSDRSMCRAEGNRSS